MFDGLMGSKFVAKCKQVIKTTLERVARSRSKKSAMLNFLKKDIAQLLDLGYEEKALTRMDGVVSDSNHIRCYDLIADFCETIAVNFPALHKHKSECPPECVEAVATLIFAAARFSDLPELCRLRSLFMERYGTAMESSVNPEFMDKVSKRTLSTNGKLKMMQEIAQEHGVNWNSNNYGQKKASAPPTVQSKQDVPIADHQKGQKPVDVMRSASAKNMEEQNVIPRQRVVDPYQRGRSLPKEQLRQPVARDIHIAEDDRTYYHHEGKVVRAEVKNVHSSDVHQNVRKETRVEVREDAEIAWDSKKNNGGAAANEEAVKLKPASGLRSSSPAPPPYLKSRGVDQVAATPVRGAEAVTVEKKPPAGLAREDGRNKNSDRAVVEVVEEAKYANRSRASNVAPPPYVKQRGADGAASWDQVEAVITVEKKAPVGLTRADGGNKDPDGAVVEEVEKVKYANRYRASNVIPPPYVKQRHNVDGTSLDKAVATQPDLGLGRLATHDDKQTPAVKAKEDESNRALKEVHVYMKPSGSKIDDHSNKITSEEATDRATPKKEHPNGAASPKPFFWPPPYVKSSDNKIAANPVGYPNVANPRSTSEIENLPVLDECLGSADRLQKPRSVRRNHRKPPPIVEDAAREEQPFPDKQQQNDHWRGLQSFEDIVIEDDAGRHPRRRKPQVEPQERGGLYLHQDGRAEPQVESKQGGGKPQVEPKQRGRVYSHGDGRTEAQTEPKQKGGLYSHRDNKAEPQMEPKQRGGFHLQQDGEVADADDNAGRIRHERKPKSDKRRHHHASEDVGPANAAHDAVPTQDGRHQRSDRRVHHHYAEKEANEDEEIDFLLMHYSKKGTPDNKRQIKRVVSLPHEDSPKAVRVPARALSSLTDEPGPNGSRPVRYQLPDYDELAARFNALKRS